METSTKQIQVTKLTASEGMMITNAAEVEIKDRLLARVVVLAVNDSPDNYREITEAEADEIRAQQKAAMEAEQAAMRAEQEAQLNRPVEDVESTEV